MFQFYGYYHFVFWDVAHSPTLIISVNRVSYTELLIRAIGSCLIHPASGHCVPEQGFVTVGEGMSQSVRGAGMPFSHTFLWIGGFSPVFSVTDARGYQSHVFFSTIEIY